MSTLADLQRAIEENHQVAQKLCENYRLVRSALRLIAANQIVNVSEYANQVLKEIGDR